MRPVYRYGLKKCVYNISVYVKGSPENAFRRLVFIVSPQSPPTQQDHCLTRTTNTFLLFFLVMSLQRNSVFSSSLPATHKTYRTTQVFVSAGIVARDNRVQWITTYAVFGNRRYTLQLYLHFSYQCEGVSFFVCSTCNNLEIFNVARHRFLGYLRQVILSLNVRQYRSSVRQIWRKQSNLLINSASVSSILKGLIGE